MNEECKECNQSNTGFGWCQSCNAEHFKQNFGNWTSGNDNIDDFIKDTQLSAIWNTKLLEWVPYDRFSDVKYIAEGGFGKIYSANWIDGRIWNWDKKNKSWNRRHKSEFVALKSLNDSKNVTLKFINEVLSSHRIIEPFIIEIYGITQDPETKNYMIVLQYAEHRSLRNYLDQNYNTLGLKNKIYQLYCIANGLDQIHKKELIHRNLHIGNILRLKYEISITDIGLCKPANYDEIENENNNNNIYGILPYIAPEILRRQNYTKAADIYSFGIIMYEVISGLPPHYDESHDESLAIKICQGFRPRFNIKVPESIVRLIKKCLDATPSNRPTADKLWSILIQWCNDDNIELHEEISNIPSSSLALSYETHSEAIYTSRLLNFDNLPEPKNSDYYYEQNDNIISMEIDDSVMQPQRKRIRSD